MRCARLIPKFSGDLESSNPINKFYSSICEGCQKNSDWHVFWIGISDYTLLKDCIEYALNKPKSVI